MAPTTTGGDGEGEGDDAAVGDPVVDGVAVAVGVGDTAVCSVGGRTA